MDTTTLLIIMLQRLARLLEFCFGRMICRPTTSGADRQLRRQPSICPRYGLRKGCDKRRLFDAADDLIHRATGGERRSGLGKGHALLRHHAPQLWEPGPPTMIQPARGLGVPKHSIEVAKLPPQTSVGWKGVSWLTKRCISRSPSIAGHGYLF